MICFGVLLIEVSMAARWPGCGDASSFLSSLMTAYRFLVCVAQKSAGATGGNTLSDGSTKLETKRSGALHR
jgi:hypothetical protein